MKAAALPVTLGLVLLALLRRRTALREPSDVASQVDAVLALLLQPTRTRAEEARLAALMLLLSQSQAPKGDGQLGNTDEVPWRLVWTQRPLFWAFGDKAGQHWDTKEGSLRSEIDVGPFRLSAHGRFVPTADSGAWGDKPVYTAGVESGEMAIGSLRMPFLLKGGAGEWTVSFADTRLRIFHSKECGLAAQVPVSSLPPVQEEAAPSESPKSAA